MGQAPSVCGRLPTPKIPSSTLPKTVELGIFGFRCIDLQPGCSQKISTAIFSPPQNIAVLIFRSIQKVLPQLEYSVKSLLQLYGSHLKSVWRYCFFCRNLVLFPVLRLFPAGRRWVHGACHRLFHLRCGRCSQLLPVQVVGQR